MYKYRVFVYSYGEIERRTFKAVDCIEAINLCAAEICPCEYILKVVRVNDGYTVADGLEIPGRRAA